jgi:hypothetical protein
LNVGTMGLLKGTNSKWQLLKVVETIEILEISSNIYWEELGTSLWPWQKLFRQNTDVYYHVSVGWQQHKQARSIKGNSCGKVSNFNDNEIDVLK